MARCLLALGSNLGDRRDSLRQACRRLANLPQSRLLTRSQWHETMPIGGPRGQAAFLNGAALIETALQPVELLKQLQEIETRLGRQRKRHWDARKIDLDLLLYDQQVVVTPVLVVPHLRMSYRRFVLEPATEIAPWMVHPTSGWLLAKLLGHLNRATGLVAIVAAEPRLADWLVEQLRSASVSVSLKKEHSSSPPSPCRKKLAGGVPGELSVSALNPRLWLAARENYEVLGGQDPWEVPGLILALEVTDYRESFSAKKPEVDQHAQDNHGMSRAAFCKLLDQPGQGPLARIEADDPAAILEEALIAIRSAWPVLDCKLQD